MTERWPTASDYVRKLLDKHREHCVAVWTSRSFTAGLTTTAGAEGTHSHLKGSLAKHKSPILAVMYNCTEMWEAKHSMLMAATATEHSKCGKKMVTSALRATAFHNVQFKVSQYGLDEAWKHYERRDDVSEPSQRLRESRMGIPTIAAMNAATTGAPLHVGDFHNHWKWPSEEWCSTTAAITPECKPEVPDAMQATDMSHLDRGSRQVRNFSNEGKPPRHCGACGKPGHNRRKCPAKK